MMGALTFSCSFVHANFCCVFVLGGKKAAHTHTCMYMYTQINYSYMWRMSWLFRVLSCGWNFVVNFVRRGSSWVYSHTHTYTRTHVYRYIYIYICIYMYTYKHAYIYIHIYICIHMMVVLTCRSCMALSCMGILMCMRILLEKGTSHIYTYIYIYIDTHMMGILSFSCSFNMHTCFVTEYTSTISFLDRIYIYSSWQNIHLNSQLCNHRRYGVAVVSRIDWIIGLLCKRGL